MKKALLVALLVSGMIFSTTPSRAEDLMGALSKAYNNSQLSLDRAAVRVVDENVAIARSGLLPSIYAFASYARGNNYGIPYYLNVGSVGIQLDQVIFDGFSTKYNISAAELQAAAQREFLRNSEQNQLYNGVVAYADVYMARRIAALRQENLAALDEQVRSDKVKLEVGELTRTDLAQSQAERAQAVSQLHLALADVKSKEAVYRQVIGGDPDKQLARAQAASGLPSNIQQGFEIALAEHPAISSARYAVEAASYKVKADEGALLPQINFRLASSYNEIYEGPGKSGRTNSIGLSLSVPIYEGGSLSGHVRQSKEQLGQAQIQVDIYIDQVRKELVAAWSQLEGARASVSAYRDSVAANIVALNGRIEENKVGQATTLDVLNTRAMLINSKVNLVSAERDALVASYGLVVAIGRMNAQQLQLNVAYYDPKVHFDAVKFKLFGFQRAKTR